MMRMLVLLCALLGAGCGGEQAAVVARIGEETIGQADFDAFVAGLPPGLRSSKDGRAADREHLQSMIDEALMFMEARASGVDTSAVVVHQLRAMARQRLVERYRTQVILSKVLVTKEDVERAFVELGYNRERLFNRILVHNRTELEEVLRGLTAGEAFEQIAARFAANDLFAKGGQGQVGWVGRTNAERRFGIPVDIFLGLPTGQVGRPVQLAGGWQVFRFSGDRETEFAEFIEEVDELLRRKEMRAREEEEFERLRHRYKVQLHPEGVDLLLGRSGESLSEDVLQRPFYTYTGGQISVAEGLRGLQAIGVEEALRDSAEVAERIGRLLLPVRLFEAEAQKRGWTEEATFVKWRERKSRELILNELFKGATADAVPSDAELEAYYEANKDRYRTQEAVIVHELLTPEEAGARKLRDEWGAGAAIADLLDRPGVRSHAGVEGHGVREHGWEMRLVQLYKPRYPELVEAAFAARVGELVGPIESKGGYAVFKVLRREGGEVQSFEQARRRVEASLRSRRENERIGAFIRELQEKYKDQIAILVDWE